MRTMGWLTVVAVLIAVFRLLLVIGGIWVCSRRIRGSSSKCFHVCCSQEARRKICYLSGIIYLLGLLPHTFCLLATVSADLLGILNCNPDDLWLPWPKPSICWTQITACAISSVLHVGSALWLLIVDRLPTIWPGTGSRKNFQLAHRIAIAFVIFVCATEGLLLLSSEGKSWKTISNAAVSDGSDCEADWNAVWTSKPTNGTRQIVRVQLLLCEEKLPPHKLKRYLRMSAMSAAPFLIFSLVCWLWGLFCGYTPTDEETASEDNNLQRNYCKYCSVSPDFDSAVNLLSIVIACWLFCGRPIVVGLTAASEIGFVDFGTHLLLTLSVIVPISFNRQTLENEEQNFA